MRTYIPICMINNNKFAGKLSFAVVNWLMGKNWKRSVGISLRLAIYNAQTVYFSRRS